jgi:hypothetical protein
MTRPSRHSHASFALLALAALLVSTACSNSTGCSALAPIPGGRYQGPKTDNAVTVRLSPHGINYLNANWKVLLETFAPGQKLSFPLGCSIVSITGVGEVVIADQGRTASNGTPCTAESCGLMDGRCCTTGSGPSAGCSTSLIDTPRVIDVTVTGFSLVPQSPDRVRAVIDIQVDTNQIYLSSAYGSYCFSSNTRNRGVCSCASPLKCSAEFRSDMVTPNVDRFDARVTFSIDQRWDKLLAFQVTTPIDGTQICGTSNAPNPPTCLQPGDLSINGQNNCGVWCEGANIDFIKELVLGLISPMLQSRIKDAVDAQSCMACGAGLPACPTVNGITSSCKSGTCVDNGTNKCVPRFLGIEGRLSQGLLLSGFGVPLDSQLDLSIAAGSEVSVNQGINLSTRAGVNTVNVATCVPTLPAPQLQPMTTPNFDAEAPAGAYHVGVGVATSFLDLAMHHAHQSGTLCISMSSANFGILNTGLFKTFLPSLGRLATRDGKDAPMMVVMRPATVPQLFVGEGTFDPVTKKPVKPLLTLSMKDLTIDFYAMIDDRFVRLFSLTADIAMPLSLIFENCSSVTPALGDLKQLITNVRTSNSEMLAEDPNVLAELIPAVIGLAEPALGGALQPFELPELGAFKLKVSATKGLTAISGTDRYEHLGLYAQLMSATAQCSTGAPKALARLVEARIPVAEEMRLTAGEPLPWPLAVLRVDSLGGEGTPEYAWRVDGGMWSTFLAPSAGGELEVSHPRFLLQGVHTIEVRTRLSENPHGISAPVKVDFRVDWEAPEIFFTADREAGVLEVRAQDFVSAPEHLLFAYRVGDGPVSSFGAPRVVDLEAVEAQGGLEVLVKDEAGNVGRGVWRVPVVALRPEVDSDPGAVSSVGKGGDAAGGCSGAGGGLALWALGAVAGALWRRRRAQRC